MLLLRHSLLGEKKLALNSLKGFRISGFPGLKKDAERINNGGRNRGSYSDFLIYRFES